MTISRASRTNRLYSQPCRKSRYRGFTGDDIIKLVKVRREQGVPLKSVRIDKGSVVSGAVSLKDWESLRSLVDTLSWFDTDTDSNEFRRPFVH